MGFPKRDKVLVVLFLFGYLLSDNHLCWWAWYSWSHWQYRLAAFHYDRMHIKPIHVLHDEKKKSSHVLAPVVRSILIFSAKSQHHNPICILRLCRHAHFNSAAPHTYKQQRRRLRFQFCSDTEMKIWMLNWIFILHQFCANFREVNAFGKTTQVFWNLKICGIWFSERLLHPRRHLCADSFLKVRKRCFRLAIRNDCVA